MVGFYALDDADFEANGCMYECGCNSNGSLNAVCNARGGQCTCLANTEGRTCDQCKQITYGFGQSDNFGCRACACNAAGVLALDMNCDVITGQCSCKDVVDGRQCDSCAGGYFGLSSANPNGCDACDCFELGTVANETCDDVTGQCPCIDDDGDVASGGRRCVSLSSLHILMLLRVFHWNILTNKRLVSFICFRAHTSVT